MCRHSWMRPPRTALVPRGSSAAGVRRPCWRRSSRALSRNPNRIDEAARLIADLQKTEEGKELLPDGLDEIWEPVWQARRAVKR